MPAPLEKSEYEALQVPDPRKMNRYRLHRTRLVFRIIALSSIILGLCMNIDVVANARIADWRIVHLGLSTVSECLLVRYFEDIVAC